MSIRLNSRYPPHLVITPMWRNGKAVAFHAIVPGSEPCVSSAPLCIFYMLCFSLCYARISILTPKGKE